MQLKKEGHQAAMIYIIQRKDISCFKPAFAIDPQYAKTLNKAWKQGVDIIPIRTTPAPEGISIDQELPFDLGV
jgi:sugar fermentation stimulation protein A